MFICIYVDRHALVCIYVCMYHLKDGGSFGKSTLSLSTSELCSKTNICIIFGGRALFHFLLNLVYRKINPSPFGEVIGGSTPPYQSSESY